MSTRLASAPCPPAAVRNKSKANSCQDSCFRVARWFPPAFISAIVGWSYYAYVVNLCLSYIPSTTTIVFYLLFYHVFFILFVYAYYRTIFSDPASVPDDFYPPDDLIINYFSESDIVQRKKVLVNFARSLPVAQRNLDGSVRFCDKCQCCKPDRTHHCGVIGKCVLKMDHFCPWVNNTVGWSNYKMFMLFLFYAIVYCLYVASTSAPYFVDIWTTSSADNVTSLVKFNVLFVFFVALMFSLSVLCLFSYHVYLTLSNQSTIESFHPPYFANGPDRRGYRLSLKENWKQVFGQDWKLWFLPIATSTVDGIVFPCRTRACSSQDLENGASQATIQTMAPARAPSTEQLVNLSDASGPAAFTPIVNGITSSSGGYGSSNREY